LKSVHKTFAEKQKNKSKLSKVLMVGAAATGLTCFLVSLDKKPEAKKKIYPAAEPVDRAELTCFLASLVKKTKGGIKLDPTVRPTDRADNWFKWLGGTKKDVTDFLSPTESLSIISNPKYEKHCRTIEADLHRMEPDKKYLQQINGSEEVMREIMYKAARNADYYQEHSRLIVMLMHVFAEPDEENGNYKITNERKAKVFFIYNIFTKVLDMMYEIFKDFCKEIEYDQYYNIFIGRMVGFLIDELGIEHAILFWELAISKASKCSQKVEYIYNILFMASKFFSDRMILFFHKRWSDIGAQSEDIDEYFSCITTEMYESFFNEIFNYF
jgi:hypothetical protein